METSLHSYQVETNSQQPNSVCVCVCMRVLHWSTTSALLPWSETTVNKSEWKLVYMEEQLCVCVCVWCPQTLMKWNITLSLSVSLLQCVFPASDRPDKWDRWERKTRCDRGKETGSEPSARHDACGCVRAAEEDGGERESAGRGEIWNAAVTLYLTKCTEGKSEPPSVK